MILLGNQVNHLLLTTLKALTCQLIGRTSGEIIGGTGPRFTDLARLSLEKSSVKAGGTLKISNRPMVFPGLALQPPGGVDCHRMSDGAEHMEILDMVSVSVGSG
jgi:hypothetical protein